MNLHLFIADDDNDIVELLAKRSQGLGFQVDSANNAMTALGKIEENLPDVVVLDVDMPLGSGLSVCEMMSNHEDLCSIPVILLTGSTDKETIRRCHQMCAYYVLKGPNLWSRVEPVLQELFSELGNSKRLPPVKIESTTPVDSITNQDELMDTVFAVLGSEQGESLIDEEETPGTGRSDRPWVLSIEDDDDIALAIKLRLRQHGVEVIRAGAGTEGYRKAFLETPRAIILDYELPSGNGDYVLRRLKESTTTSDIPVIVLTGRSEPAIERQMRSLGASEFLTKPLDWNRLRQALDLQLDRQANQQDDRQPNASCETTCSV